MDPLAEEYSSISPNAYVANNPLIYIDPDGRRIVLPNKNQAKTIAADLNRVYQSKYGVDDAFAVATRNVTVTKKNPNRRWWHSITGGESKTIEVIESRTYVEANSDSDFDWSTDKYSQALKQVIDADTDIRLEIVDDMTSRRPRIVKIAEKGLLEGAGGGFTENSRSIILSELLSKTEVGENAGMNNYNWTFGLVALHELLYHVHPMGARETSPNIMRDHYDQGEGDEHGSGSNVNIRIIEDE